MYWAVRAVRRTHGRSRTVSKCLVLPRASPDACRSLASLLLNRVTAASVVHSELCADVYWPAILRWLTVAPPFPPPPLIFLASVLQGGVVCLPSVPQLVDCLTRIHFHTEPALGRLVEELCQCGVWGVLLLTALSHFALASPCE